MFGNNTFDKKILKLIDQDEKHDKTSIVSAIDLLKRMRKRFILMQDILKPLINVLSKEIIITNIYFDVELDDNFSVNIDYIKDGMKGLLVLCQLMENELEIAVNTHKDQLDNLIMDNKKIIIDTFNNGLDESFDKKDELTSTSGLLLLSVNNHSLEINNSDMRNVSDQFKLLLRFPSGELLENYKLSTTIKVIEEMLNKENNMNNFLEHIKVYEKNIPYYLSK